MTRILALAALAATLAFGASAHADVENPAVKARMAAMKTIGGSMKTLGGMAKGAVAFDAAKAQAAVDAIAEQAELIPALFEANETDPKSEAAPAIWTNYDDFLKKTDMLKTAASVTLASQADLGPAMGGLGGSCKACHTDYRIKK